MTQADEELCAELIALAKRTGFTVTELDDMARGVSQADIDPLPAAERGAPFEFGERKVAIFADDDFLVINAHVPPPDAELDLLRARDEFEADTANAALIFGSDRALSLDQAWQLFVNGWNWFRFWAVRHPRAECRMAARVRAIEAEAFATVVAAKARRGAA